MLLTKMPECSSHHASDKYIFEFRQKYLTIWTNIRTPMHWLVPNICSSIFLDQWNFEWEFNWNPALPCDTSHLTYYRISWARKSILYFRPFHRKSSRRKYFGVLATCLIWGCGKNYLKLYCVFFSLILGYR